MNCVAPGILQSGVSEAIWDKVKDNSKVVPTRRRVEAEGLTARALMFANDASEYMTGTRLLVDEGLMLGMTLLII